MRPRFGRFAGMTTEALVLRRPDYVVWMLREAPDGVIGRDFTAQIERFDARVRCGEGRASCLAPPNQPALVIVDRTEAGNLIACGVSRIDGFSDAVAHLERTFVRGRRQWLRRMVRNLVIVRGMQRRFTNHAAVVFLRNTSSQ